ncbi:WhiB family transcriptional regulator [Rhodococcus jostii]|uniref:WhiB family transcriptional regulator n=1 Tax=Rhodococcus jostii TaxID=132919 RepID=UPI00115FA725|nr:WhiB family transcriptional regulator [Rhodococcus jostii]
MTAAKDSPAHRVDVTLGSGDWWALAACRDTELAVFFSPDDERGRARDRRETQARQICRPCPVLVQCRNHALVVGETYGVWGGMTEGDRRKHSRRRRRGERQPLESLHTRTVAAVPRIRESAPRCRARSTPAG